MTDLMAYDAAVTTKVTEALVNLGDTPLEVFENLLALKCYGDIHDAGGCPIWKLLDESALKTFIAESVGTDVTYVDVCVNSTEIGIEAELMGGEGYYELRHVVVTPPSAVSSFIESFDAGVYPQLEA